MKTVTITVVPHKSQRYPTVGDWYRSGSEWRIVISDLADDRMNLLVAIHELIEMTLCEHRGIDEESVTKFDMKFEAARAEGDDSEPGDHHNAPYRKEHQFATRIERQLAKEFGVDWTEYERRIQSL